MLIDISKMGFCTQWGSGARNWQFAWPKANIFRNIFHHFLHYLLAEIQKRYKMQDAIMDGIVQATICPPLSGGEVKCVKWDINDQSDIRVFFVFCNPVYIPDHTSP